MRGDFFCESIVGALLLTVARVALRHGVGAGRGHPAAGLGLGLGGVDGAARGRVAPLAPDARVVGGDVTTIAREVTARIPTDGGKQAGGQKLKSGGSGGKAGCCK